MSHDIIVHDHSHDHNDEELLLLRELLHEFRKLTREHPHAVEIQFLSQTEESVMATGTEDVGVTKQAVVVVKNQFNNPMTGFDFAANPPSWSIADPAVSSIAAGDAPDHEAFTGVAAGTTALTVEVPNVLNGSDTATIVITQPADVATSVEIQFP